MGDEQRLKSKVQEKQINYEEADIMRRLELLQKQMRNEENIREKELDLKQIHANSNKQIENEKKLKDV